jgi:hypothetical protein
MPEPLLSDTSSPLLGAGIVVVVVGLVVVANSFEDTLAVI